MRKAADPRPMVALCLALTLSGAAQAQAPRSATPSQAPRSDVPDGQWRYFGGSKRFERYSPLRQIDRGNVNRLAVAWVRPGLDATLTEQFPDLVPSSYLRGTPMMIDGVLYVPNAVGLIEASAAATGKTLWVQQPFKPTLREVAGQSVRGADSWQDGPDRRIIAVRGQYLYELERATGKPVRGFGEEGRVLLDRGTPDSAPYFNFNGPIVVGDVIVLGGNGGGRVGEGFGDSGAIKEAVPEDIRGYDVRSGRQLWTFHIIPGKGAPERQSWGEGSADYVGHMGAWGPLTADESLGYVYVPLTTPTGSYYGGHRPGNNLYSTSLVCLDAHTGKLVWGFQTVHHDIWDYDNASPPILGDITVGGRRIKAVMEANKNAFLYVLDRVTGKPVWPIVERPVPQSSVPGEHTAATQPFPTKPPAFDRQGLTPEDLIDFTPQLKREALEIVSHYEYGPLFTPPSVASPAPGGKKGTLTVPSSLGAAVWNTGAFDPQTGIYYATSTTFVEAIAVEKSKDPQATMQYQYAEGTPGAGGGGVITTKDGLPLVKPPYGRITALDLNKGEKLWTVANGDGPREHPLLKSLHLPPLGSPNRSVPLVTGTLLFVADSGNGVMGHMGVSGPAKLRAFDKKTGELVSETEIPAGATGGLVTYEAQGKQYIVVPIGSEKYGTGWVALALK